MKGGLVVTATFSISFFVVVCLHMSLHETNTIIIINIIIIDLCIII